MASAVAQDAGCRAMAGESRTPKAFVSDGMVDAVIRFAGRFLTAESTDFTYPFGSMGAPRAAWRRSSAGRRASDATRAPVMSRYKAASIHLMISAALVGSVFGVVFRLWYPAPAFEIVGASSMVQLLIGVDLMLGPTLTLIVFRQGKPGLKFDLAVIALVQITALCYGSYRLYDEKPDYLVFAIDRLEFISGRHVDASAIRFDELRLREAGKLTLAVAEPPADPDQYQDYLNSVLVDGKPDLESRPEFWRPWSGAEELVRAAVRPLGAMEPASPEEEKRLQEALERYSGDHPNLGVIPIGGIEEDIGMLIDRDTLEIVGTLRVDPWATG